MCSTKTFCICIDVYKIYDGYDIEGSFEILSELEKKLKIRDELKEKR